MFLPEELDEDKPQKKAFEPEMTMEPEEEFEEPAPTQSLAPVPPAPKKAEPPRPQKPEPVVEEESQNEEAEEPSDSVYRVTADTDLPDGVYEAVIRVEGVKPISFLFG